MTTRRPFFGFRLSRCNRTGLVLWLGVGLLVVLIAALPGRRVPAPSAEIAGKEERAGAAKLRNDRTADATPAPGIIRASATR